MNFNPSNLYISIVDLFAILLPGAIASLVIYYLIQESSLQEPANRFLNIVPENSSFIRGFALLFSSYLFGHLISQVSAYLDEWVYDRVKERVYKDHKCVDKVKGIREKRYANELDPVYVNTYKWSVFKLQKEYPEAAAEVERYMADSKFFRSLFIILILLVLLGVFRKEGYDFLFYLSLAAAFSMVRYFKKRRKATETAYQYIIFTEELNTRKD